MSHKTEMMLYKKVCFQVGWVVSLNDKEIVYISKNGSNMQVPGLSGVNVHDLAPDVDIQQLLRAYEQTIAAGLDMSLEEFYKLPIMESNKLLEVNLVPVGKLKDLNPLSTIGGLKRGAMIVFGALTGKSKPK